MRCNHCWRDAAYTNSSHDRRMCGTHFKTALYRGKVDYDNWHLIDVGEWDAVA